jgi:predicted nucleic acid binding AN1-type Zn finger protein
MPIDLDYLNALLNEMNLVDPENMVEAMDSVVKAPEKPVEKPVLAERPKRCQGQECGTNSFCKTKLVLSDFPCQCKGYYCSKHRYAEAHSCTFDYKGAGEKLLTKNLVRVEGEKVQKI